MDTELRNKIEKDNEAARRLKNAGYSLQGVTKNMDEIAVEKDGKFYYFANHSEAAKSLLNKTTEDYIKELTEYSDKDWDRKGYREAHRPVYTYTRGKKFDKVLATSGMSTRVHCFIDRSNGDLYKPASYSARAQHVRGNINDDKKPFLCGEFYLRM